MKKSVKFLFISFVVVLLIVGIVIIFDTFIKTNNVDTIFNIFYNTLRGKTGQSYKDVYIINNKRVDFSITADFSFATLPFHRSASFQKFLDECDFDLTIEPKLKQKTPQSIEVYMTDKYPSNLKTEFLTLDPKRNPMSAFVYEFQGNNVRVNIYIHKNRWDYTYNFNAGGSYKPSKAEIINEEILYALARFDHNYPNTRYGDRIGTYLHSAERLL